MVSLQEIKAHPSQLTEEQKVFPGYEVTWNPATRPGYSGVATFLRAPAVEVQLGMELGLDARDGRIAVKGWTALSDVRAVDLLKELSDCAIAAVVYTDIARDGMLNGPNLPAWKEIVEFSSFPVIASGGITSLHDLRAVQSIGPKIEGAIIGKALYDGNLDYQAAVAALSSLTDSIC